MTPLLLGLLLASPQAAAATGESKISPCSTTSSGAGTLACACTRAPIDGVRWLGGVTRGGNPSVSYDIADTCFEWGDVVDSLAGNPLATVILERVDGHGQDGIGSAWHWIYDPVAPWTSFLTSNEDGDEQGGPWKIVIGMGGFEIWRVDAAGGPIEKVGTVGFYGNQALVVADFLDVTDDGIDDMIVTWESGEQWDVEGPIDPNFPVQPPPAP